MSGPTLEVFVSYSHRDAKFRAALELHLAPLRREKTIRLWTDGNLKPGQEWKHEILSKLAGADLVLLLVSSNYLASDFCYVEEMGLAIARHDAGSAKVVPILLTPCDWKSSPFAKLQVLPAGARPVSQWKNRAAAWLDVVEGLRRLVEAPATAISKPAGPVRAPLELPPAAERFFGREDPLQELIRRLRQRKNSAVVGAAGFGKTALAAEALSAVVGSTQESLAASPFPDGVVFLNLYALRGQSEPAWNSLANTLQGPFFLERRAHRERAAEACRGRSLLVVVEGGEVADGKEDRTTIPELLSVLSPQNRQLVLTREKGQVAPAQTVELDAALAPNEAEELLVSLAGQRCQGDLRSRVLQLLAGHPLALTWAGNLLTRGDEAPARLVAEWEADRLPALTDPQRASHTLEWLFQRSVQGLPTEARQVLAAAGLLAQAPFPIALIQAALPADGGATEGVVRAALRSLVRAGILRLSGEQTWQFTHMLGYRFARQEKGSDPELRERLAQGLHTFLLGSLANGAAGVLAFTEGLSHAAALLRTDHDQRLWPLLAEALLYDVGDGLQDRGYLPLTRFALSAVREWFALLPAELANEDSWLRELGSLLNREGIVAAHQGDLDAALAAHQADLTLSLRLAAAEPSNVERQRDLSISHHKIADVWFDRGNLDAALAAYRESLDLIQALATADPENAEWRSALSGVHDSIGLVLRAQGNLSGALAAYQESLALIEALAGTDLPETDQLSDLGIGHERIGDVQRAQGNLDEALASYSTALALSQRVAAADESNTGWQRGLSCSHFKVGEVLRDQGNLSGALAAFGESLALSLQLVAIDPSNTGWQRDLSLSYESIGDVLRDRGDLNGALEAYRLDLAICQRLAATDRSNARWQRDLSVSRINIADVLRDQNDLDGAIAGYREALDLRRRLTAADRSNTLWQRELGTGLHGLADLIARQGRLREALPVAEESLAICKRLAALDPTNATWQKDLQTSLTLIARLRDASQAAAQPGSASG